MTQPSDFETPPGQSQSKSSSFPVLWILGGLGCGCFGLFFIGIISAIALPSLLTQTHKAKQAEAKYNVAAMLRAQQAYQLEKGTFGKSIEELGIGVKPETENYSYQILPKSANKSVMITAQSKKPALKSYTGAVFAVKNGRDAVTITGVCETNSPVTTPPAMPKLTGDELSPVECPPGSKLIEGKKN